LYNLVFYTNVQDDSPIDDFLDSLDKKSRAKVAAFADRSINMKKSKVRTFQGRLKEDMKAPEFKAHYKEERQALMLAMKIAKLREKKSLSQLQLARLMGTSQQAISRLESGEYEGFTLKTLEKIAEVTGTRVEIKFVTA
jgi:DNA-binding transcriptional regulator YiaG